uniref:L-dopachrome isomerase n=1 Tax=Heterorhabditis bacteriophora TaxID=37862 RepID=A0A1I7W9Q9_HETBA
MPVFSLNTNVHQSKISGELLKELSASVARILGKPESIHKITCFVKTNYFKYVAVHIQGDQTMYFGGSDAPCAVGVLKSIGGVGGKVNNDHAKVLFALLKDYLQIDGERYIEDFILDY